MGGDLIQAEFEGYIKAVYKGLAPGSDQYEHIRGAFFGGAFVALKYANLYRRDLENELAAFGKEAPIATRELH